MVDVSADVHATNEELLFYTMHMRDEIKDERGKSYSRNQTEEPVRTAPILPSLHDASVGPLSFQSEMFNTGCG